jgi:hypothetical protein
MAGAKSSKSRTPKHDTEADGYKLVADMLRDVYAEWRHKQDGADYVFDEYDWMKRDWKVLPRYLAIVRDSGSAAFERGFIAALSEFMGSSPETWIGPEYYDNASERARHG